MTKRRSRRDAKPATETASPTVYSDDFPLVRPNAPFRRGDITELYPKAFVADLCRRAGLTTVEQEQVVWDFLRKHAAFYRLNRSSESTPLRPRDLRRELSDLARSASEVASKLSNLSYAASNWLWHGGASIELTEVHGSDAPAMTFQSRTVIRRFTGAEVAAAVQLLSRNAADAADHAKRFHGQRGRPDGGNALRLWVINARNYWHLTKAGPFTSRWHQGQPVSRAAIFCWEPLHRLDPAIRPAAMAQIMRHLIAEDSPRVLKT